MTAASQRPASFMGRAFTGMVFPLHCTSAEKGALSLPVTTKACPWLTFSGTFQEGAAEEGTARARFSDSAAPSSAGMARAARGKETRAEKGMDSSQAWTGCRAMMSLSAAPSRSSIRMRWPGASS